MVELLVAMVLMAVALLACAASFPYALYGIAVGGFQTTATLLAEEAIERARAASYESIPFLSFDGSSGRLPSDCSGSEALQAIPTHVGFRRCVGIHVGAPSASTTTITAVVEFVGPGPHEPWRTTIATIRAN